MSTIHGFSDGPHFPAKPNSELAIPAPPSPWPSTNRRPQAAGVRPSKPQTYEPEVDPFGFAAGASPANLNPLRLLIGLFLIRLGLRLTPRSPATTELGFLFSMWATAFAPGLRRSYHFISPNKDFAKD